MGLDGVASPCISVCRMNQDKGWCEGCWRTLDEIAQWAHADDEEKRAILARAQDRRKGLTA